MPGRKLCSHREAEIRGFGEDTCRRRREILQETIIRLSTPEGRQHFQKMAARNLESWRRRRRSSPTKARIHVYAEDWGEVTRMLSETYGECFAVLNMANAYVPGGAYVEGAPAQEENMYRRTDCHFYITDDQYDADSDMYKPHMTDLLEAKNGRVYLDTQNPRVCCRGPEDRMSDDLGYEWLSEYEAFPFFELRASASDLRTGQDFCPNEARRRIDAQLQTLIENDVRFVVLSAFGCGAFQNPPERVAEIYIEAINRVVSNFSVIAFAILWPGYGPDNYSIFRKKLLGL